MDMAIDREYGKPDFPLGNDPFSDPKSPPTFSTELENTDTFSAEDIFELGFLRSNPERKIYQHSVKPTLFLEELFEIDFRVKDRIARRIVVFSRPANSQSNSIIKVLYNSTKPSREAIELIIKQN